MRFMDLIHHLTLYKGASAIVDGIFYQQHAISQRGVALYMCTYYDGCCDGIVLRAGISADKDGHPISPVSCNPRYASNESLIISGHLKHKMTEKIGFIMKQMRKDEQNLHITATKD